jgi:MFS family permease
VPSLGRIFYVTSLGNISLFAACQAGLVNNLNDGMSWGLYPLYFAVLGLGVQRIGVVKAVYPICWGLLQIVTGPLSDRYGRKGLIVWGMIIQAAGIWLTVLVPVYGVWIVAAALQGLGTAMVSRRSWPLSPTTPIRRGGRRAWASTDSGGIWATRWVLSCRGSWLMSRGDPRLIWSGGWAATGRSKSFESATREEFEARRRDLNA